MWTDILLWIGLPLWAVWKAARSGDRRLWKRSVGVFVVWWGLHLTIPIPFP